MNNNQCSQLLLWIQRLLSSARPQHDALTASFAKVSSAKASSCAERRDAMVAMRTHRVSRVGNEMSLGQLRI